MVPRNSDPRGLQQQPSRQDNAEQQQAGSNDFQPKPEAAKPQQQMGEGSYEATRDYQKNIKDKAEEEGKSHSKGEH